MSPSILTGSPREGLLDLIFSGENKPVMNGMPLFQLCTAMESLGVLFIFSPMSHKLGAGLIKLMLSQTCLALARHQIPMAASFIPRL